LITDNSYQEKFYITEPPFSPEQEQIKNKYLRETREIEG
jgi:hypothetical protein